MISVEKAKAETRTRDVKRARIVLRIGGKTLHLSTAEAHVLAEDLLGLMRQPTPRRRKKLCKKS